MRTAANWPYPKMIAHRGAGKLAPENTLSAMRLGYEMGYRMAEYDAKLSADQIVILLHDAELERTTNGQGLAGGLNFSELACLDAGSWHSTAYAGEAIPTLNAIARYTLANNMASNIEIKPTPGQETLTGQVIAQTAQVLWKDAVTPPLLTSFSAQALEAAKSAVPSLPRGLLSQHLPEDWLAILTRLECVSLHLHHEAVTKEVLDQVQAAGFRLAAWTVNDPERAQELLTWGIDAVITDNIDQIRP